MKKTFRTKDISIASLLYASEKKLISTQDNEGRRYFIFEDFAGCRDLVDKYWRHEALIDGKTLMNAYRSIKDLLFNQ